MNYDPLWKEYLDVNQEFLKVKNKINECNDKKKLEDSDNWIKNYTIDISSFPSIIREEEPKISKINNIDVAILDIMLSGYPPMLKKSPEGSVKLKGLNTGIILSDDKISIFITKDQKLPEFLNNTLNEEKDKIIENMSILKKNIQNYNSQIAEKIKKQLKERLKTIESNENFFK